MSQPSSSKFKNAVPQVIRNPFKSSKVPFFSAIPALQSLLTHVDLLPALYTNRSVLSNAIRRYERLWLPLVFSNPKLTLVPPIDIHWVWICHMFNPVAYARDTNLIRMAHSSPFRADTGLVDHTLLNQHDRLIAIHNANLLWNAAYPSEPFDLQHIIYHAPMFLTITDLDYCHLPSQITYDIITAASRQLAFYYQVCIMPQYFHKPFLRNAVNRYFKGFLQLNKLHPDTIISPTYDIDLIWHCHMLHPVLYAKETTRITGFILPHDYTLNDQSPGSNLNQAWDNTYTLWTQHISEDGPAVHGGMSRGNVTAEERALRPILKASISAIRSQYSKVPSGNIVFNIELGTLDNRSMWSRRPVDIQWLHLGDNAALDQHTPLLAIERFTEMVPLSGKSAIPRLTCIAVHRATNCRQGHISCEKISSVIEIQAEGDNDNLPLATAHKIDKWDGATHLLPRLLKRDSMLAKYESEFVLRIAGEDAAILVGRWIGFQTPIPGIAGVPDGSLGVPGRRGEEGYLELRLLVLNTGVTQVRNTNTWQLVKMHGENPAKYAFEVGDFAGCKRGVDKVTVNLKRGQIWCSDCRHAVLGYLLGMSVAMMYVVLQPRFKPGVYAEDGEVASWYPEWGTAQIGYKMLEGAGGEMKWKGLGDCYGGLEHACFGERAYVGNVDSYQTRNVRGSRRRYVARRNRNTGVG